MHAPTAPRNASRRTFLSALASGAGSVLLTPACLRASADPREEVAFIVVSDTHLGYRDQESAARRWETTAAEIATAPGDFVLHLGDVVDGGREAQYPIYLKSRKVIEKPVYEIPGNHDPRELFQKYVRKTVDTTFDHRWLRVLLIGNAHRDSHDGFLTDKQIAWIDEQGRRAGQDGKLLSVCMHVPAHKNLHPDRGWYVKPENGQTDLYAVLGRHQQRVLAIFHGHFHNGVRGWEDHGPLHEICFPSALYNRDRNLEKQNAPGYNLKEFRPGYTLVTIKNQTMQLTYKPVGAEAIAKKQCRLNGKAT